MTYLEVDRIGIEKLEIEDGDILLVSVPADWTMEQIRRVEMVTQQMVERANKRAVSMVFPNTIEFKVVKKTA